MKHAPIITEWRSYDIDGSLCSVEAGTSARVITAAPDLLAALKDVLDRFQAVCPDMEGRIDPADLKRIEKANEAIKRAEA